MEARAAPLDGLLVLDLGQIYQGPYCALLLSFLGARVVKVEPPGGDLVRARSRAPRGPWSYLALNANKQSVVLDLKRPEGREALLGLVERADVLVENLSPGALERLGLGADMLAARNPRLVHASGTGFGSSGPYAGLSAMDLTVQAMSGLLSATGFPDGPPVKSAGAVADFLGAAHLTVGILAALVERERSGLGQRVESSMHEAAVLALCSSLSAVVDAGPGAAPPERVGNRHPALSVAPYNVYRATDGWVAVNCPSQRHWEALAAEMGRPDLIVDPRFLGPVDRAEAVEALDAVIEAWTSGQSRTELVGRLAAAGVPCAPVCSVREVVSDPHLAARGAWTVVEDPVRGPLPLPRAPLRLSGSPERGVQRTAPDLGADTDTVLTELLGLAPEDVAALRASGALGT